MTSSFSHRALSQDGTCELIYTAMSKHYFYFRMHISKFVLQKDKVPINPFMLFDYFLLDSIDRDIVRNANNTVIQRADAIWVFGPISNGVLAEIVIGHKLGKPIRYFKILDSQDILEITADLAEMESDIEKHRQLLSL